MREAVKYMILVGKEPFCDFPTIGEAVQYAETKLAGQECRVVILSGVYQERVTIRRSDFSLCGIGEVILTNARGAREKDEEGIELGTFRTATLFVGGSRNRIENLTIENKAGFGEIAGQALAVYADCDETVFRNCRMLGYQDTLFTGLLPSKQKDGTDFVTQAAQQDEKEEKKYRQYYENCFIAGSIDFIFGGAAALFKNCEIRSRKEGTRSGGYITAASTPQGQEMGFVFDHCWLTAEEGVNGVYLGRPWRSYAKTTFVCCQYGPHIHPEGWHDWSNEKNRKTADYREYYGENLGKREIDQQYGKRAEWSTIESIASSDSLTVFPDTDFYKKEERCDIQK